MKSAVCGVALIACATQTPSPPTTVQRAAEIFAEARSAIESAEAQPSPLTGADATTHMRAGLLIELAKGEASAFPDAAADDATRAVRLIRTLASRDADIDPREAAADPAVMRGVLAWMAKAQLELEAVKLLTYVKRETQALELARTTELDRADLYDPIVRATASDRILRLAAECRDLDGSYPYVAVADRARSIDDAALRQKLLESAYATAASETAYKRRALALTLLRRSYDLVPSPLAARALNDLLQAMIANPAHLAGRTETDRDLFGPEILQLMMYVDPQLAGSIALAHPDWEAARKTPGRTSLNPIGGPGPGVVMRPATPPPPPPPLPTKTVGPIPAGEIDHAIAEARSLTSAGDKIQRLIAIGYSLSIGR